MLTINPIKVTRLKTYALTWWRSVKLVLKLERFMLGTCAQTVTICVTDLKKHTIASTLASHLITLRVFVEHAILDCTTKIDATREKENNTSCPKVLVSLIKINLITSICLKKKFPTDAIIKTRGSLFKSRLCTNLSLKTEVKGQFEFKVRFKILTVMQLVFQRAWLVSYLT